MTEHQRVRGSAHGAARPAVEGVHPRARRLHTTEKKNVDILTRLHRREPLRGSAAGSCCASSVSPVEILGTDRVEGIRIAHNELVEGDGGSCAPAPPTSPRSRLRASVPVDRLSGHQSSTAWPFDERSCTIPTSAGASRDRCRGVRGGLDQARAQRDHRHEQARRQENVGAILEDLDATGSPHPPIPSATRWRRSSPSGSPTR